MAYLPKWLLEAKTEPLVINIWSGRSRKPMVKEKLTETQRREMGLRRNGSRRRRVSA